MEIKQKSGTGYTNLKNHITLRHGDNANEELRLRMDGIRSQNALNLGVTISKTDPAVINMYRWIEWIVECNLPFNFIIHPKTRALTNLKSVSVNTVKKYMERLVVVVEKEIQTRLPDKFGLIIDGWSDGSDHFMAVFATYMFADVAQQTLLAVSPMGDETSLGAKAVVDFIEDTLLVYGKGLCNIAFLISDNTALNPKVALDLGVPFIGCMSHRLNLAVNRYFDHSRNVEACLVQLHDLMSSLRSIKLRAALRAENMHLSPIVRNKTRWSSTFAMLERFFSDGFEDAVSAVCRKRTNFRSLAEQTAFASKQLSPESRSVLKSLLDDLNSVEEVTKLLQTEGLTLLTAQDAITVLLERVGDNFELVEAIRYYCLPDSQIVPLGSRSFISSVIKLQGNPFSVLNANESASILQYLKTQDTLAESPPRPDASITEIMKQRERKRKRDSVQQVQSSNGPYETLDHIQANSNACERLFSAAGLVFSDLRRSMLPRTLKILLFLKSNRKLWGEKEMTLAFENPTA
jgi:hypothetical protein